MAGPKVLWTLHSVNTDGVQPIFRWPVRSLLPTISPLLRPILPVNYLPADDSFLVEILADNPSLPGIEQIGDGCHSGSGP